MSDILPWITSHWNDIFAAVGLVVTAASAVVRLTPTAADDAVLEKVIKWIEYLSVFNRKA